MESRCVPHLLRAPLPSPPLIHSSLFSSTRFPSIVRIEKFPFIDTAIPSFRVCPPFWRSQNAVQVSAEEYGQRVKSVSQRALENWIVQSVNIHRARPTPQKHMCIHAETHVPSTTRRDASTPSPSRSPSPAPLLESSPSPHPLSTDLSAFFLSLGGGMYGRTAGA